MIFYQIILLLLPYSNHWNDGYAAHDFHLSLCEVSYSNEEQSLQMSLRIFSDDLALALENMGHEQVDFESVSTEDFIGKYLKKNFTVQYDGTSVDYDFLGMEEMEDLTAVWCYMEIPGISFPDELSFVNRILFNEFDDQQNVIQISGPNREKGYLVLTESKPNASVNF